MLSTPFSEIGKTSLDRNSISVGSPSIMRRNFDPTTIFIIHFCLVPRRWPKSWQFNSETGGRHLFPIWSPELLLRRFPRYNFLTCLKMVINALLSKGNNGCFGRGALVVVRVVNDVIQVPIRAAFIFPLIHFLFAQEHFLHHRPLTAHSKFSDRVAFPVLVERDKLREDFLASRKFAALLR